MLFSIVDWVLSQLETVQGFKHRGTSLPDKAHSNFGILPALVVRPIRFTPINQYNPSKYLIEEHFGVSVVVSVGDVTLGSSLLQSCLTELLGRCPDEYNRFIEIADLNQVQNIFDWDVFSSELVIKRVLTINTSEVI